MEEKARRKENAVELHTIFCGDMSLSDWDFGSFRTVTDCADTVMQMRRLDRVREGMLSKVKSVLCGAGLLDRRTGVAGRRYKGKPFSYFAFLDKNTKRPKNMSPRQKIRVFSYSEL